MLWKLGMDNKYSEVLSFPLALVTHNLCEEERYHTWGDWKIPEWKKTCARESVPAPLEYVSTEGLQRKWGRWHFWGAPKIRNGAPWKRGLDGQCKGKQLRHWFWYQRWAESSTQPGTCIMSGLSLLLTLLWHLPEFLHIFSATRELFHSCYVWVFPRWSLRFCIQQAMHHFPHSNSFWCIWQEKVM